MAIKLLENAGIEITGIGASALNNLITGNKSGIVGKYLNECAFTATGNTIIIDKGLLIICGRQVEIDAIESITLSSLPSEDVRYQIVIELIREESGEVTASIFTRQPSALLQENLLKDGFVYQFELGRVTHKTTGQVTEVLRTADILTAGGGGADFEIGDVTTEMLAEGIPAEVDIEKRTEDDKTFLDFTFAIPKNDLATALGAETNKAPTNKLLNDTAESKANKNNPILTGQMFHNGQQFGVYPLYATEASTNYIKVASMKLNSYGTGNSRVLFQGIFNVGAGATEGETILSTIYFKFRTTSSGFSAEIMGYTALKPSTISLLGTWYYTANPTTKYADLYYKPLGGWRNACLTVLGVSKLAADSISFTTDNLGNTLPYDTGSTSVPATPSGGASGIFNPTDWKQFVNGSDISTVMPLSSAAASNTKVLGEKVVYDEFAKKANDNGVVKLTTDQTIDGIKTFTGTVTVPTPVNDTDAATKDYADNVSGVNPFVRSWASGTSGTLNISSLGSGTYQFKFTSGEVLTQLYSVVVEVDLSIDASVSQLINLTTVAGFGMLAVSNNGVTTLVTTNTIAEATTWTVNTTKTLYYRKLS